MLFRSRGDGDAPLEIRLVGQDFLATSVDLAEEAPKPVRLVVLKSFDEATRFLASLNRWIV